MQEERKRAEPANFLPSVSAGGKTHSLWANRDMDVLLCLGRAVNATGKETPENQSIAQEVMYEWAMDAKYGEPSHGMRSCTLRVWDRNTGEEV